MKYPLLFTLLLVWGAIPEGRCAPDSPGEPQLGSPFYRYFSSNDFRSNGQNFAIARGEHNLLYFANLAGVLQFDGTNWKTLPTTSFSRVTALYADRHQRIWVGANGEFGFLAPDSSGAMAFQNLSHTLKEQVGYISAITENAESIAFVSTEAIYSVSREGKLTVAALPEPVENAFTARDKIFFFGKHSRKILQWSGRQVTPLHYQLSATGEPLDLKGCLNLNAETTLMLTSNQGVFLTTDNVLKPLNWPVNANKIVAGAVLPDNLLAFATSDAGIVVTDHDGNVVARGLGSGNLQDNQINSLFHDGETNLWLALNDGIACLTWPSPISVFDKSSGLKGDITSILRHENTLYVGTLSGLYTIQNNSAVAVNGFPGGCLSLTTSGGILLAATPNGVYEIRPQGARKITTEFILSLYSPSQTPGQVLAGLPDGLAWLSVAGGAIKRIPGVRGQVSEIVQDEAGDIWLETLNTGIYRYKTTTGSISHYTSEKGLPANLYAKLAKINGQLMASTQKGFYRYNPEEDRWTKTALLPTSTQNREDWADRAIADKWNNLWLTGGDKRGITFLKKNSAGEGYTAEPSQLALLKGIPFERLFADDDAILWAGGAQGLFRIDSRQLTRPSQKLTTLISGVTTESETATGLHEALIFKPRSGLKAGNNKISFRYIMPSFHVNETVVYQYFLENYSDGWSDWSPLTTHDFSGLPAGQYLFKVRGKDIFGSISTEASVRFTIVKPWYFQWWMISLYLTLLGLAVHRIVLWRIKIIVREKQNLEKLISERTEEIEDRKQELEEQSGVLSATNDQLERIDSFVKAINSEVNTQNLFDIVLNRLCQFQNVDTSSALMSDKNTGEFRFVGVSGAVSFSEVAAISMSEQEAHARYVGHAIEIYEDIYLQNDFRGSAKDSTLPDTLAPKSLVAIAIRTEGRIRSFITLENITHTDAFSEADFLLFKGMKEHLAGAYIKTSILENLEDTLHNLQSAQEELIRQEKLASVGQLTKGIVDRILNPLNYINNFAQSSTFLVDDIQEITDKEERNLEATEKEDLTDALQMLKGNLEKIFEHGNSTSRIVKDMQKLLKGKSDQFLSVDVGPFIDTRIKATFQELLNQNKDSTIRLELENSLSAVKLNLLPGEFSEVIHNLIGNAFYALTEKSLRTPDFQPVITVKASEGPDVVTVSIKDNGKGIPAKEMQQLFSPFFTTKPTSKGTGLGLYMTKDIVEYHKGKISIQSTEGAFTEVLISLPKTDLE